MDDTNQEDGKKDDSGKEKFFSFTVDPEKPLLDKDLQLGVESTHTEMMMFVYQRRRYDHSYLFIDPHFQPDNKPLIKVDEEQVNQVVWNRPHEMTQEPKLITCGVSKDDVVHCRYGATFFMCACIAISLHPSLLKRVLQTYQSLCKEDESCQYFGILIFKLWRFGKWFEVVVDDNIPTIDGENPLYGRSTNQNEYWLSFLEKAYAKLHGGYEQMLGAGTCVGAITDLTGGITSLHDLRALSTKHSHALCHRISRSLRHGSYVWCGLDENALSCGDRSRYQETIITTQPFAVLRTTKVLTRDGRYEIFFNVYNIWNHQFDWDNSWRHSVRILPKLDQSSFSKLPSDFCDPNQLWLSYSELKSNFRYVYICNVAAEENSVIQKFKPSWKMAILKGVWINNINSGGCPNQIHKYAENPQFRIKLKEPDDLTEEDGDHPLFRDECLVQVALMQEHRRPSAFCRVRQQELGLRIYKVDDQKSQRLNVSYLSNTKNLVASTAIYKRKREVILNASLQPGSYVIIPSTSDELSSTTYLLRILTEKSIELVELT